MGDSDSGDMMKDDDAFSDHDDHSDSAACEHLLRGDSRSESAESVPQFCSAVSVSASGRSPTPDDRASSTYSELGGEVNALQLNLPPRVLSRAETTSSISALLITNCSTSHSTPLSDITTDDEATTDHLPELSETQAAEFTRASEVPMNVGERSEQTLVKERFHGFQRLPSPEDPRHRALDHQQQRGTGRFGGEQIGRNHSRRGRSNEGQYDPPTTRQTLESSAPGRGSQTPSDRGRSDGRPEQRRRLPELTHHSQEPQKRGRLENRSSSLDSVHAFRPVGRSGNLHSGSREVTADDRPLVQPTPQRAAPGGLNSGPAMQPTHGRGNTKVEVRGMLRQTTEETLQFYFQNSIRSGGGKIRHLRWDKTTGLCLLSFESAEVAQRTAERQHHLEGKELTVKMHDPKTLFHGGKDPEEVIAVRIGNFHPATTTSDALLNHFENPRNGGGEVLNVKIGKLHGTVPSAVVTFRSARDAQRAVAIPHGHQLNGRTLTVVLHGPACPMPNAVSLRGLPIAAAEPTHVLAEDLQHFVESTTNKLVYHVLLGNVVGVALVFFEDSVDFAEVEAALRGRPFRRAQVKVERVPVTSTVEVHRLPPIPSLSTESLTNYFQNTARSGGKDVTHVHLFPGKETALVTFKDPEVCCTVVSQSHRFHNAELDVRPHYECVGLCEDGQQSTSTLQPPTAELLPATREDPAEDRSHNSRVINSPVLP
ncbi:uncharacterized protein LOC143280895 [Babylonia areolata]|uniref:uncharacterized protein LOC143280895 n=1 Tax=Babylonia areolata TaxID=304850 RepID=UPI003FCFAB97